MGLWKWGPSELWSQGGSTVQALRLLLESLQDGEFIPT